MIYADNASTSPLSNEAKRVILELTGEFGNPSSPHSKGISARKLLNRARSEIKELIGASESDILVFTSGGSEANAQALFSALGSDKKELIISAVEHDSVFNSAKALERFGLKTTVAGVDSDGIVSTEKLGRLIGSGTALVSVMTANNETGVLQPVGTAGSLCRERGVIFHTDAVQAVGHIPICFKSMNADMLSFSAHKFGGMKGVGALCIRGGVTALPLINGGMQESGLRAGTENIIGIASMAAALKESLDGFYEKQKKVLSLRSRLTDGLARIDGVSFNGDHGERLPGIVNVSFSGVSSDAMLMMLDSAGICVSSGAACRSAKGTPSRVLTAMGLGRDRAMSAIRFSLSHNNTEEEIDYIIKTVKARTQGSALQNS